MVQRLYVPFPVLNDAELRFTRAVRLPTLTVAGHVLTARIAWAQTDGVIRHVFYPVLPPDGNASQVLDWLDHEEEA